MATQEKSDSFVKFQAALEEWNKAFHDQTSFDPIPILNRLSGLLEQETEEFYKMDPDPLDDRPPGRQLPTCGLGQMMKIAFKNEDFMNTIVGTYLLNGSYHNGGTLFTAACRVLLVLLPGLETSVPFREMDGVVERLYYWAEFASEPLKSYATGLLSGAMELNDMAVKFRDESIHMVPIMLTRLHELMKEEQAERENKGQDNISVATGTKKEGNKGSGGGEGGDKVEAAVASGGETSEAGPGGKSPRYFAAVAKEKSPSSSSFKSAEDIVLSPTAEGDLRKSAFKRSLSPSHSFQPFKYAKSVRSRRKSSSADTEHSNSSWAEMRPLVIGSYSLHPLTSSMKQRLIMQYLTPLGDYHELLSPILEHDAMTLIFYYINLNENKDIRLAFDALRFLSVILCHKKFASEFIARKGIQRLLEIHRPSIAATGVSLCFYYITYFEDATERVCALPRSVLSDLVSYNLWLMECSHDSSRCHACLFFSQSFAYKVIIELFDQKDGLRRLVNVISTLNILNTEERNSPTDDELHQMRQAARLVCEALRKYFEVHTVLKSDELRYLHHQDEESSVTHMQNLHVKTLKSAKLTMDENLDMLLECMPPKANWAPEVAINRLGGLNLLCQLVAMSPEWDSYQGKTDTIVAALEVLTMCACSHRTLLLLCRNVSLPDNVTSPIMSVIVGLVEGEVINEAEVQKAALRILCNCVCGPTERFGQSVNRFYPSGSKKKGGDDDLLSTMWNCVRTNNGIMVLLKLLSVKTPIVEADRIRTLACKALAGMSRSETIRQIIGKRPPLNNGQLQSLVKEPVLADKRTVHLQFCKYAHILLEKIAGKDTNVLGSTTLQEIRRAGVVAQTKIVYQDRELLQIIHEHLSSKGLHETATALQKEASLPKCSTPPPHSITGHFLPTTPKTRRQLSQPSGQNGSSYSQSPSTLNVTIPATQNHTGRVSPNTAMPSPSSKTLTNSHTSSSSSNTTTTNNHHQVHNHISTTTTTSNKTGLPPSTPSSNSSSNSTNNGPIKFSLNRTTPAVNSTPQTALQKSTKRRFLKEKEGYVPPGVHPRSAKGSGSDYEVSLDKIVTEYLRKQHALCPQPISTCPTMSLFEPHQCPEPLGKDSASVSIVSRIFDRQMRPPHGGPNGQRLNRRYLHSKMSSLASYRDNAGDGLACCAFDCAGDTIFLGSFAGELRAMSLSSSSDDFVSTVCHSSPVIHISTSMVDPDLIITGTWGASQNCALWGFKRDTDTCVLKYRFDEHHATLANLSHDRFIGTKDTVATIYDTTLGTKLQTLYDESKANNYKFNEASFNPTDDLVLNDGNLWDVRSNKMIYKFDKFNQYTSGCFHPSGLEVVINSEIWDIRTFRLLHTVPALDQCQIMFNHGGDVIYAIRVDDELSGEVFLRRDYASTLRTFDALNYSSIGTFDLKTSSIFDLAVDRNDQLIGVIENTSQHDSDPEESICRVYELGKQRVPEDQADEEEESPQNDDDYDDDDDDDDTDDSDEDGDDDDDPFEEIVGNPDSSLEVSPGSDVSIDNLNSSSDEDNGDLDDMLFELV